LLIIVFQVNNWLKFRDPISPRRLMTRQIPIGSEPAPERGRATLATSLVERLRQEVLSGELLPGQRIRLEELRDRYGVSLSPLREAVSRLGSEGLLLIEDQRGVRVAPVSAENLAEVVELRADLEPKALRDSILHADEEGEVRITGTLMQLSRQEKTDNGQQRVERWERLHRQLHMSLISACRMPLLLQFCSMLNDRGDRYRRLFLANRTVDQRVALEHHQLVEACLERDADKACGLLRAHIEGAAVYVYEALARQDQD